MTDQSPMAAGLLAAEVPSIRWSPAFLGRSECEPIHLTGSPAIPLPPSFLSGITAESAAVRQPAWGSRALREAIAGRVAQTTGVLLDPEHEVVVTNGAMHGLDCVFRALLSAGTRLGMVCPTFFADRLLGDHVEVVRIDTSRDDGWHLTEREFEQLSEVDAVFLVNPNNPTGVVYTDAELQAVVEATEARGALLILDEAYEAFVYDGRRHVSMLELAPDRVVTVQSFTKSFGLVAARVGCVFGPSHLLAPIRRIVGWVTLASNPLTQPLAVAAIEAGEAWRGALVDQFVTNRALLVEALAAGKVPPGTSVPEGATFSMLDVSAFGGGSEEVARRLWVETGIACVPGIEFPGDPAVTDKFLRLPLGAPEAEMAEALDRLAGFFG